LICFFFKFHPTLTVVTIIISSFTSFIMKSSLLAILAAAAVQAQITTSSGDGISPIPSSHPLGIEAY
jgi:hypothetical protein